LLSGPQWPRRQVPVLACKGPAGPQRAAVLFPTRCSVKSASRPLDARTEVPIAAASEPLVRARSPAAGRAARTLPPAVTNRGGDGVADAGDGDRVPIARSARPPTLTIGWSLTQGGYDTQAAAPGTRRPSRTQVRVTQLGQLELNLMAGRRPAGWGAAPGPHRRQSTPSRRAAAVTRTEPGPPPARRVPGPSRMRE
jgi:hypothetical protein